MDTETTTKETTMENTTTRAITYRLQARHLDHQAANTLEEAETTRRQGRMEAALRMACEAEFKAARASILRAKAADLLGC